MIPSAHVKDRSVTMTASDIPGVPAVLALHPELRLVVLFGSVATGRARADSDLDIAVRAERPLSPEQRLTLIGELAEATGRPVDLVDLATVGEPLLGQILTHGIRLLGSDEQFARLLVQHLMDEADFLPYRRRILEERRKAWIGR